MVLQRKGRLIRAAGVPDLYRLICAGGRETAVFGERQDTDRGPVPLQDTVRHFQSVEVPQLDDTIVARSGEAAVGREGQSTDIGLAERQGLSADRGQNIAQRLLWLDQVGVEFAGLPIGLGSQQESELRASRFDGSGLSRELKNRRKLGRSTGFAVGDSRGKRQHEGEDRRCQKVPEQTALADHRLSLFPGPSLAFPG